LFAERVRPAMRTRAELPLLAQLGGRLLRGSIDLLVERDGAVPLIVDYKNDRLGAASPTEAAERYAIQRDLYALAVSEALGAASVEVAYVFLERAGEPALAGLGPGEIEAGRRRLEAEIRGIDEAAAAGGG
jgi:ATP-dependent exoDNAse (exonuclease V) beta subunit